MLSAEFPTKTLMSLLSLLSLLVLTSCTSRSHRFGIIYTSNHGTTDAIDIYRILDSTQNKVEQLTFTPTVGEYQLLVSKDGEKIVFMTGYVDIADKSSFKQRHVYLFDVNSKQVTDITKVLVKYEQVWQNFNMDWSPDQKQYVMVTWDGAGSESRSFLEFVNFDGTNKKDIRIPTPGNTPSLIMSVQWSPDEKKFLLTQGVIGIEQQRQNPGAAILIYEPGSGVVKQITDYKDNCFPEAWSPTNQQIVATCAFVPPYGQEEVSGPSTVRIFDVENLDQPYERIGFSPCDDPSWSPDGKQIVFVCDKGTDQVGLFIANSDGNGIREVNLGDKENSAVIKNPTWSPDGTQIIYVIGSDYEHTNIYSVYPDGSNNHLLTNQEAFYNIVAVYPIP